MSYNSTTFPDLPNAEKSLALLTRIGDACTVSGPRMIDRPLALYGAGNLGRMAKEYLDGLGIDIGFVVDLNAENARADQFWSGVPIYSLDQVTPDMRASVMLAVCVVTAPYVRLAESLRTAGWEDIVPFYDVVEAYRDRHPLSNGWFANKFSQEDIEKTSRVLELWDDDASRAHHLQFLAWRCLREEWIFVGTTVTNDNRFFIPEVMSALGSNDSFADLGAHTGSVTEQFIKETNSQFKKIWAVEPDPTNLAHLRKTIAGIPDGIEVLPVTLGSLPGNDTFFQGAGYASQRSSIGLDSHQIQTIDNLDISPTFMKFHLEGGELDALKGSMDTIQEFQPIIAATSYHNHLGIWELPLWMMDNLKHYKFYMRTHSWCGTGAVVYAIPGQ